MAAAPCAVAVEGGRCAWRLAPHGRLLLQRRKEGAETNLAGVPGLGSQQWAIPGRLTGHESDLHPPRRKHRQRRRALPRSRDDRADGERPRTGARGRGELDAKSEEPQVGKECVRTCSYWWSPYQ